MTAKNVFITIGFLNDLKIETVNYLYTITTLKCKQKLKNILMEVINMEHININPIKSGAICEVDLFGKKGFKNAIKKLKWKIVNDKLVDSSRIPVKCSICETQLSIHNFAAFFPGSVKEVCSRPECFIGAIYETKRFE